MFFTDNPKCSTKPLSKVRTIAMKLSTNEIDQYNHIIYKFYTKYFYTQYAQFKLMKIV